MTTGASISAATAKQSVITPTLALRTDSNDAGNVHAVERCVEGEIRGITLKKFRVFCKMKALVHDLDDDR